MQFSMLWIALFFEAMWTAAGCRLNKKNMFTYTLEHLLSLWPWARTGSFRKVNLHRMAVLNLSGIPEQQRGFKQGNVDGEEPPLQTITLCNVRPLRNTMDELTAKVKYDSTFRQSNLLCFKEIWFKLETSPWSRADRHGLTSHQSVGGALCIFVDNKWQTQFWTLERVCSPDHECLFYFFNCWGNLAR